VIPSAVAILSAKDIKPRIPLRPATECNADAGVKTTPIAREPLNSGPRSPHGRSCQPVTSMARRCCRSYEMDLGGNSFGALNLNNFQGRCAPQ
jgi:hypothetical protein